MDIPPQIPGPVTRDEAGRVFLTVGSQRWELSPLESDDWAAIRERVHARKLRPLDAVLEELQYVEAEHREYVAKHLFDRAYADIQKPPEDRLPTREEVGTWMDSNAGGAFSLYRMLRRKHPDVTEQQAAEVLKAVGAAALQKNRDEANRQWIERAKRQTPEPTTSDGG